jgi:hypothetical protein
VPESVESFGDVQEGIFALVSIGGTAALQRVLYLLIPLPLSSNGPACHSGLYSSATY